MKPSLAHALVALALVTIPARAHAQCTVTTAAHAVGRRATLEAPLVLATRADETAVGWVVPARSGAGAGRDDDPAVVRLGPASQLVATTDPEQPSAGGGQFPNQLFRVTPANIGPVFATMIDSEYGEEPYRTVSQCGSHRSTLSESVERRGEMQMRTFFDATYTCRSVAPERPFLFGARAETTGNNRLGSRIILQAGADSAQPLRALPWQLPMAPSSRQADAMAPTFARDNAVEGAQAVRAGDAGWLVTFRFQRELYAGWVDPTYNAIGALATVGAAGSEKGLPAVAWNGTEVLLVHSSRADRTQPWTLVAERVPVRGAPAAPQPLASNAAAGEHTFAPSVAALPNGWAVSYTTGPLTGAASGRARQHAWLRAFDAALAPRGEPARLTDEAGGSDARIVASGARVVGAYFGGQATTRDVRALAAQCR